MTIEAQIEIAVEPLADADAAELAELAGQLRSELLDAEVERVDFVRAGSPPPGAKAVDVMAIGRLIVEVGRSVAGVRSVVAAVRSWVSTHRVGSVKIQMDGDTLEITRVSSEEQRRLIEAWITRHSGPVIREPG